MKVSRVIVAGMLATTLYGACAVPQLSLVEQGFAAEEDVQALSSSVDAAGIIEGSCEKQEVVYGSLTSAGAVKNLYVVNELFSDVPVMVRDYGTYSEALNLTDEAALARDPESVTLVIEEESFVYQGNLASTNLPWNVSIRYELDGQPIAAADLAGKSGGLTIAIETSQNTAVDPLYFDNYLLQITCTLPMEHAKDIETDGGTLALSGSDTSVSFNAMPGKAGAFSLTAQVSDFEMEGISIAAVPFSMAIEGPDSAALAAQFDALIEGASQLDSGASRLNDGVQSLEDGTRKLDAGVGELQSGASELSTGMSAYLAGVSQVNAGLAQVAAGSATFAQQLSVLQQTSEGIAQSLDKSKADMQALAAAIQTSSLSDADKAAILGQLSGMSTDLGKLDAYIEGVGSLASAYDKINDPLQRLSGSLAQIAQQGSALESGSNKLDSGASELANSTGGLTQGTTKLADGAAKLSEGTDQLATETKGIPDKLQAEIDKMLAEYDKTDFTPQSFVDARNTNVKLVQFVMTTEAITLPDSEPVEPEAQDESFLSRFFALFS